MYLLELCRVCIRPKVKVVSVCLPSGAEIVRPEGACGDVAASAVPKEQAALPQAVGA